MSIEERKLTGGEKRSKEANFKKLKKVKGDFKDRYGKDAESVMHAVATKQAKNEDKNADYVEEKAKYKSDPKLKNLRVSDIPSEYEKRKYAAQGSKKNEDVGADLPTTNQRTQRMLNLIRANNPTAKNDFEAILLSLAKAKKNLSNDEDQADIAALRQDVDGLKLLVNQMKGKVDGLNESATLITEEQFDEAAGKKDACYHKVKSRYKVWPSAYASGALVQCRKKGAKNWGNSKKK